MIKGLYEGHLPVSNLKKSIEFYRKLDIELAEENEHVAFFWIKRNESWIGLWEHSSVNATYHPSLRHIAFYVSLDDLRNAKKWLEEKGIQLRGDFGFEPIEPIVMPSSGHAMIYFNDPDGNSIEFITKLPVNHSIDLPMMYLSEWERKQPREHNDMED
ncbi:VOC family protein [Bacillus timonensis]|nr:VOC family protein [Bacillus timonensis]